MAGTEPRGRRGSSTPTNVKPLVRGALLRGRGPDVVVTYDPNGGHGDLINSCPQRHHVVVRSAARTTWRSRGRCRRCTGRSSRPAVKGKRRHGAGRDWATAPAVPSSTALTFGVFRRRHRRCRRGRRRRRRRQGRRAVAHATQVVVGPTRRIRACRTTWRSRSWYRALRAGGRTREIVTDAAGNGSAAVRVPPPPQAAGRASGNRGRKSQDLDINSSRSTGGTDWTSCMGPGLT